MIDSKLITALREKTGAGIVDVKAALDEAASDLARAEEILRKKGIVKAGKKADRGTGEGLVHAYIHDNKIGVLVELLCETDFVARTDTFKKLAQDIAMHIAAMDPLYLTPENIPPEVIEKEQTIFAEELKGKPQELVDKILAGKMEKYYSDVCLLRQAFIRDDKMIVEDIVKEAIGKLGENIRIGRFTRYTLGAL